MSYQNNEINEIEQRCQLVGFATRENFKDETTDDIPVSWVIVASSIIAAIAIFSIIVIATVGLPYLR